MLNKEKPRLSRLTSIITQLQAKRLVTARQLAEKHEVSLRTIYRDIRTLEQSGIPIITEEGKGYSLMEGYQLPPIMITENEANALITAEQIILKNKDQSLIEHYCSAVTKIKAVFRYNQKDKADLLTKRIHYRDDEYIKESSNYLINLQSAITNNILLDITYNSLANKTTKRTIEPFAIYSTKGNWIIIAFCRLRQEYRAFRIDRINALVELNKKFEPHNMTLEQYFEECVKKNEELSKSSK